MKTDVVETRKARPVDVLDGVVRDQEVLLPPHEHVVCLFQLLIVETVRVKVFRVLVKGKEFALQKASIKIYPCVYEYHFSHPMFFVDIFVCVPFSREEWMFVSDYFAIKESHHLWILVRQVLDF